MSTGNEILRLVLLLSFALFSGVARAGSFTDPAARQLCRTAYGKFTPYLALDIETSAADKKIAKVLQVSAVFDDGSGPVDSLPIFNVMVDNGRIPARNFEPGAREMNQWILDAIKARDSRYRILKKKDAVTEFDQFLKNMLARLKASMGENAPRKILVAGKNIGSFDIPILANNGFTTSLFIHRVLDVGSLYFPDFGYIPKLDAINELTGRPAVTHDAIEDARDVVHAVRAKAPKADSEAPVAPKPKKRTRFSGNP